jgi:hypothetical protein
MTADQVAEGRPSHAERTELAWRRTGATFFLLAIALAKLVVARSDPLVLVIGGAGMVVAVVAAVLAHRRPGSPDDEPSSALLPATITAAVALVSAAAVLDLVFAWAG